jgi:hypothetical protein
MEIKLADVLVDKPESYRWLSLAKLAGKPIVDIECYVSGEFGGWTLQMRRVVFSDRATLDCEGEHDIAYLTSGYGDVPNTEEETLRRLCEEAETERVGRDV